MDREKLEVFEKYHYAFIQFHALDGEMDLRAWPLLCSVRGS
jgi:hypothetical protein